MLVQVNRPDGTLESLRRSSALLDVDAFTEGYGLGDGALVGKSSAPCRPFALYAYGSICGAVKICVWITATLPR